jgi:hypothetical protein
MIFLLFILWAIYLTLGIGWLYYIIKKNNIQEYNMLGSMFVVVTWPIHLFYTKFKK